MNADVRAAVRAWLDQSPNVSAVGLYAPCASRAETFAIMTQHGLDCVEHLFAEPDPEDLIVDWDRAELERNVSIVEQKQFRKAA